MNRKLSYNGKSIEEMTKTELQEQLEANKKGLWSEQELLVRSHNIVITVKSNNSNDIEKLKKFDTIGGTLEIIYSDSSQDKEDLAVFE